MESNTRVEDTHSQNLMDYGYVNTHLFFNVQTKLEHRECNSSYTIITVPNQEKIVSKEGNVNNGMFQFKINHVVTLVVKINIGVYFCYTGFLLTHHQQIIRESKDVPEFTNIVTYNSKPLF